MAVAVDVLYGVSTRGHCKLRAQQRLAHLGRLHVPLQVCLTAQQQPFRPAAMSGGRQRR